MRQRKQTYIIIHWFNIDKVVKTLEIAKLFNFQMKFCQKFNSFYESRNYSEELRSFDRYKTRRLS